MSLNVCGTSDVSVHWTSQMARKARSNCIMTAYENYVELGRSVADEHSPWSKGDGWLGCYVTGLQAYHCLKFKGLRISSHCQAIQARATSGSLAFYFVCLFVFGGKVFCSPSVLKLTVLLRMTRWFWTAPPTFNSQVPGVHMCVTTPSLWGAADSNTGFPKCYSSSIPTELHSQTSPALLIEERPWEWGRIVRDRSVFSVWTNAQCDILTSQQPQRNSNTRHISQHFQSHPFDTVLHVAVIHDFSHLTSSHIWERIQTDLSAILCPIPENRTRVLVPAFQQFFACKS